MGRRTDEAPNGAIGKRTPGKSAIPRSGMLKARHPSAGVKQTGDKSPEKTSGTFGAHRFNSPIIATAIIEEPRKRQAAFGRATPLSAASTTPGVSRQLYSRAAEQAFGL